MRYGFEEVDPATKQVIHPQGLDLIYELAKAGVYFKVLEKSGSFFKRADGGKFADGATSKQGMKKLREALADDQALQDEIATSMRKNA